jgi:hypothetical protein
LQCPTTHGFPECLMNSHSAPRAASTDPKVSRTPSYNRSPSRLMTSLHRIRLNRIRTALDLPGGGITFGRRNMSATEAKGRH